MNFSVLQVFIVLFDVLSFNRIGDMSLMLLIGAKFINFFRFCPKLVLSVTLTLIVFNNNYRIFLSFASFCFQLCRLNSKSHC